LRILYSTSKFKPARWLTNAHFQTLAAKLFRRKEKLETKTETLELPDGDFIDLAWTEQPQQKLPEHLTFEVSSHGGHVGFIHGNNPLKPQYWLEQRVPDFLNNHIPITSLK